MNKGNKGLYPGKGGLEIYRSIKGLSFYPRKT
jgi:hypothetical protein